MKNFILNFSSMWDIAFNAPHRRDRVFRRIVLGFYLILLGVQVTNTTLAFIAGETENGFFGLGAALFCVIVTFFIVWMWARQTSDDLRRALDEISNTTENIVPIVPSGDAPNPAVYGMMRALETGESIHMEKRDGVWYENGKALPNMKGWD